MSVFDDNVRKVIKYACTVRDQDIRKAILVKKKKKKATYRGVDLFVKFYAKAYDGITEAKHACVYLALLPALQKLFDKASAAGKVNTIKFVGTVKPEFSVNYSAIQDKIKRI